MRACDQMLKNHRTRWANQCRAAKTVSHEPSGDKTNWLPASISISGCPPLNWGFNAAFLIHQVSSQEICDPNVWNLQNMFHLAILRIYIYLLLKFGCSLNTSIVDWGNTIAMKEIIHDYFITQRNLLNVNLLWFLFPVFWLTYLIIRVETD